MSYLFKYIAIVILFSASLTVWSKEAPLLGAASSLRTLWPTLSERYTADTGHAAPRASFASSGLLSTQILNGAPFQIFLSADAESFERLIEKGLSDSATVFALGELVLVAPREGELASNLSLSEIARKMNNPANAKAWRLAIPNPSHAPYGRAARDALSSVDLWPVPDGQLLAAENAAQTLQFVKSGAVEAALIPSVLLNTADTDLLTAALPPDSYPKVQHTIGLLHSPNDSTRGFRDWLLSEKSHQILMDAGFDIPSP